LSGIPATAAILAVFLVRPYVKVAAIAPAVILIQYFILLSGIFVTCLLLWYDIDQGNPLLRKVCGSIKQGSCSAILNSRGAKIFSWLSWSEVGFFYFTGGALSLLFVKNSIFAVAAVNLVALPYVFYSIFYQSRIARQWCVLCLVVQALLLLGSMNAAAGGLLNGYTHFTVSMGTGCLVMYMIPVYAWEMAKPILNNMRDSSYMRREFLRIKFNPEIFTTLLKTQKNLVVPSGDVGIELGDPSASNEIIKVCNPYCGACVRTHPIVEHLLETVPDLKVRIIFRTSTLSADPSIDLVKHFLAIDAANDSVRTKTALDSWYLSDRKDYQLFKRRFEVNGQLEKQTSRWEAMNTWCKAVDITFTPTFFFNGRQLPDTYNIEDLRYFLLE
jgi:thiol-disulfide isomerase/thioredoxin